MNAPLDPALPATGTQADFARIAGYRPSYVAQLKREGRLVLAEDGKTLRIPESLQRVQATRDPSKAGVSARHAADRTAKGLPAAPATIGTPQGRSSEPFTPSADDAEDDLPGLVGFQASRARKEHYNALAAQRDYELSIGKLLNGEDVAATLADALTTFRVRLEGLRTHLAPLMAAETDEARCGALLADEHERALDELARKFRQAGQAPA